MFIPKVRRVLLAGMIVTALASGQESRPRVGVRVEAEALQMATFRAGVGGAPELFSAASGFFRRTIDVCESGAVTSTSSNMTLVGDLILVRDTPESIKRILQFLEEIRSASLKSASSDEELITQMITPRHIRPATCLSVLRAWYRDIPVAGDSRGRTTPNVSVLDERRVVVLHDTRERVQEMGKALAEVDVAEPAVTITCQILQARAEGENAGLAPELVSNLATLLPSMKFGVLGFGLVKMSVGSPVGLELEMSDGRSAKLAIQPAAFDPTSGTLAVSDLQFSLSPMPPTPGSIAPRNAQPIRFNAATQLKAGEYAVVAAFGEQPVLLVLRLVTAR